MREGVWRQTSGWVVFLAVSALGCSNGGKASADPADIEGSGGSVERTVGGSPESDSGASSADSVANTTSGTATSGTGGSTGTGGSPPAIGNTGQGGAPEMPMGDGGGGGEAPEEEAMPSDCPGFDSSALEVSTVDADCDAETPRACDEGTHIDFNDEDACAVCAPDTAENRSCSWAQACFKPFLQTIAHRSGAKRCQEDSDCAGFTIAGCGTEVTISLFALIDEEIPWIAEMYAEQNCSTLCAGEPGFTYDRSEGTPACIAGECSFEE